MSPRLRPALALCAALVLTAGVSAAAPATKGVPVARPVRTGLETLEKQVQEFTLSNGLRFIVVERHQAPVFSFFTVVNSGSANDAVGTTGIAHMMEHMAFKGSTVVGSKDWAVEKPLFEAEERAYQAYREEQAKGARADASKLASLQKAFAEAQAAAAAEVDPNAATRVIEQAGGQGINAFTANDITAYFYSLPSNRLELWAAMHAGAMVDPVFREFYKERDVVYEERRMRYESSPTGRLLLEFIMAAFPAHPYGFGGIGYPSDLKSFTRTEGTEFFKRNYVAKNMTVCVVGDVKLADVRAMAEKYFGAISDAPAPPPLDTVELEQQGERRVVIEDTAQPFVFVGWHIPAASDPTYAAYKAAADLLGGGDYSRLHKALVKEQKIATTVQMFTGFPGEKYPNLLGMVIVPAAGQDPVAVEQAAYAVIDSAMAGKPLTDAELAGYKVRVRSGKVGAVEDNGNLAGELAQAQMLYGDWRQFFREQERVQSLAPADLQAVLAKAMRKSNRTVAMIQNPKTASAEGGR